MGNIASDEEEKALIEATKDVLCAPHLELVCRCARMGRCGGCKVINLARAWTKVFGERRCKHEKTTSVGRFGSPHQQCLECDAIVS